MSAFDKVIGYESIKADLMRFCDVLKYPEKYRRLGVSMPAGLLISGVPGIGKTLMAKCFIEESGSRTYILRKDKPNGDFVNEIRKTFDEARNNPPAIVFLDDMDKFANEDQYHRDAEEYVTVQACIDDCKGSGVFVVATVNDKYCLPDSLIRVGRFDKIVEMQRPKGEDAKRIITHYLAQKQVIGDVDVDEIVRLIEGYSCAELETVINEAGINAGFDNRGRIGQEDLLKACMRMLFDAPELVDAVPDKYQRNIAVHEAGHAVVSEVLEPGSVSLVSVSKYSGPAEGITVFHRPDDYYISKKAQEHEIIRKLAGKAATEIIYGLVDMGSNSDLRCAFELTEEFVDNVCAYGFTAFERNNSSAHLLENKDRRIAVEMEKYYLKAKEIIAENRDLLDAIVRELMEKKTLTQKDIAGVRRKTG